MFKKLGNDIVDSDSFRFCFVTDNDPMSEGWVDQRLNKATEKDLERWTDRVLDARSLEEVFGSNGI